MKSGQSDWEGEMIGRTVSLFSQAGEAPNMAVFHLLNGEEEKRDLMAPEPGLQMAKFAGMRREVAVRAEEIEQTALLVNIMTTKKEHRIVLIFESRHGTNVHVFQITKRKTLKKIVSSERIGISTGLQQAAIDYGMMYG